MSFLVSNHHILVSQSFRIPICICPGQSVRAVWSPPARQHEEIAGQSALPPLEICGTVVWEELPMKSVDLWRPMMHQRHKNGKPEKKWKTIRKKLWNLWVTSTAQLSLCHYVLIRQRPRAHPATSRGVEGLIGIRQSPPQLPQLLAIGCYRLQVWW